MQHAGGFLPDDYVDTKGDKDGKTKESGKKKDN